MTKNQFAILVSVPLVWLLVFLFAIELKLKTFLVLLPIIAVLFICYLVFITIKLLINSFKSEKRNKSVTKSEEKENKIVDNLGKN
jgi:threonine/homoserine/homoserine lactone efflux protein